jgi:uncharacterized protein (UPF0332 family)
MGAARVTFEWPDFLQLAEDLRAEKDTDAALRTAVSRAYYAAFHVARLHLVKHGHQLPKTGEAHEAVRQALQRGSKEEQRAVNQLQRLLQSRRHADYDAGVRTVWASQCDTCISQAKNVLTLLGASANGDA